MSWWALIKETAGNFSKHRTARLGAALAYYSVFSIGPVILIAVSVAGLVFGQDAVRGEVSAQIAGLLGPNGAQAVETMLAGASQPQEGILATLFGLAVLVFAAVSVVVQLKDAMNTVWEAEAPQGSGVWYYLRTYLMSLAGVLSLGFLLLVSLIFTAALAAVGKFVAPYIPEAAVQIVGSAISFGLIAVLFALMFKWLPDAPVSWRDVWIGALLTAALFELGKVLIGYYIGKQGLDSTYGAAASLVVILIWVYYSSQIVLIGAEFTHAYAQRHGSRRGESRSDQPAALVPRNA